MRNSIYRRTADASKQLPEPTVVYANSSIRQFLNMRRITRDKGCLVLFIIYCLALIIMLGIGFFYGNYDDLGKFVNANADPALQQAASATNKYLSEDCSSWSATCPSGYAYLGVVCIEQQNRLSYTGGFDATVRGIIAMYDIKSTFQMVIYVSAGLLGVTGLLFVLVIWFSKMIYLLISCLFLMLLGLAFYLLKNVEVRIQDYGLQAGSLLYNQEQSIRTISFVLLGLYLVIFPFVLFSPKKIQLATHLVQKLKQFYRTMSSMIVFSLVVIAVTWGSLIIEIFLIMHFFSAGAISKDPVYSMFHTYTNINLSHPAALVFHFIGVYWFYSTLVSWHKYFVSSAMCLWYFQESQSIYPVKRGLRRSLQHVGTAAYDGILMPVSWVLLLLYAVFKSNTYEGEADKDDDEDSSCISGCFRSFSSFFTACYSSVNLNSPSSAVLTNYGYFQSCRNATEILSLNSHKFFNVGGTLRIFMSLFVCILWVLVMYLVVYFQVYNKQFPPTISSVVVPVFCVFVIGLVIGALLSNIYTASVDCLLYCYLTERKNVMEGGELERAEEDLKIKKVLDECYCKSAEDSESNVYVYEEMDENTMDLTYASKKQ